MKTKSQAIFKTIDIVLLLAVLGVAIAVDAFMPVGLPATVLKKGAVFAVVAVSMNLLNGFTGLFSLGQAGFMLLGAYTYAIFSIPLEARESVYYMQDHLAGFLHVAELPVIPAMIAAGLVAAVFAFLIGLPVLRLKSDYLAIATLGFAEIVGAFAKWDTLGPITNAPNPLVNYPKFSKDTTYFIAAGVCIAIIALLVRSTYGRAFKAIRDDEIAAEAMGINLAKHKMISFVTSSFFAGVGGAMLAMFQSKAQANSFTTALTYEILLIVVIGGIGSLSGSVIASFLYIACSEWWLRFLDTPDVIPGLTRNGFRLVVFSAVIMIIVLFFRRGLMGDKEFSTERLVKGSRQLVRNLQDKRKAKEAK